MPVGMSIGDHAHRAVVPQIDIVGFEFVAGRNLVHIVGLQRFPSREDDVFTVFADHTRRVFNGRSPHRIVAAIAQTECAPPSPSSAPTAVKPGRRVRYPGHFTGQCVIAIDRLPFIFVFRREMCVGFKHDVVAVSRDVLSVFLDASRASTFTPKMRVVLSFKT